MNKSALKKAVFLLLMVTLTSCSKEVAPSPEHIHYFVGKPYQVGEVWIYPEENFAYKGTGIAVVSSAKKNKVTADGEIYNPKSMTGAHPSLQLPAIVKVRNLDNGREVVIRLNDRIASVPARALELSPQAAQLLGISSNGFAKVDIIEDENASQNLAFHMPEGPQTQMRVSTAPLSTIKVENLDGSPQPQDNQKTTEQTEGNSVSSLTSLPELPVTYTQGIASGGQLWIDGGAFTSRIYADRLAAKMGGKSVYTYAGGRRVIHVRSGPYSSVKQADQNLDSLLKSGIRGAKIIVE